MPKKMYDKLINESKRKYNDFLSDFANHIINEEASVFIGTGLSMNSGLPSWRSMLLPCLKQLNMEEYENLNLYKVAQYYANKYSDAKLRSMINGQINGFFSSNKALSALLQNNFKSIWTTNYDNLIENELKNQHVAHNIISDERNLTQISTHDHVNIYKINGDISSPNRMILTQDDYENYEYTHSLFLTFLKKELVSNTFLFVGYSFSDQIILNSLSSTMKLLDGSGNLHYALIYIDNKVTQEIIYQTDDLRRRYNVECIFVNSEILYSLLVALNNKVKEKKVFISGAYYDVDKETDLFADKLSKSLVIELLKNGNRISTGIGRRLGTYVTGYAHQYLAENGIPNPQQYLSMRPFPFHLELDESQREKYRTIMLHDCNAALFMFGQGEQNEKKGGYSVTGHYSLGVYQEYCIAKKMGLTIIPIGSTGYEAELIWNDVKSNINRYYYLSKKIDVLLKEKDPEKISKIVVSILNQSK